MYFTNALFEEKEMKRKKKVHRPGFNCKEQLAGLSMKIS